MNRDELNRRNTAAITHWWTTMRDSGRVEPGLLSDLAGIADEHARQYALSIEESHRGEHAPALREEQAEAAAPPLAAADLPVVTAGGNDSQAATVTTGGDDSTHRTRTRSRRTTG